MKLLNTIVVASALAFAGNTFAATTNLVSNGSFESGLAGWTTPGYATSPSVVSFDGSQAASFFGSPYTGGAAINQTVGTIQAGTYTFTFKGDYTGSFATTGVIGVADSAGSIYGANFILGGSIESYYSGLGSPPNFGPGVASFTSTIAANSALIGKALTVQFGGYSGDHIDDVSLSFVSSVPEPETYAMLLAGLGLIGAARRRKAQQA